MSNKLPKVTVIIPTRPGDTEVKALAAAQALDYPGDLLEIIVARGRQPSVQRNTALRTAQGDLIYFLDDDSQPNRDNLKRAVALFEDAKVAMVGGPNLCPANAPAIEKAFAVVLSSLIAFGPSRARYASTGATRPSSEKELILCNLMARRKPVLDLGGFDEALYPNEENALMDDLQKGGYQLVYDPDFIAFRRPRPNVTAFCKMLMTYGRGRAEQFRLHPTLGSALNLIPPLFCLYILLTPFLAWLFPLGLAPLAAYFLILLAQTAMSVPSHGVAHSVMAFPFLALTHLLYGAGFWKGMFTQLRAPGDKPVTEVRLEQFSASRPDAPFTPSKP